MQTIIDTPLPSKHWFCFANEITKDWSTGQTPVKRQLLAKN
jgi:hypothetical protein